MRVVIAEWGVRRTLGIPLFNLGVTLGNGVADDLVESQSEEEQLDKK